MQYYLLAFKNYTVFTGRSRRRDYWFFVLFNVIFAIGAMLLDRLLGLNFKGESGYGAIALPYGYIYVLYSLVALIPGLAVLARRLHDVGKSAWFILIVLIPLVGAIWLLVLACTDSVPGENKWGPNPKGIGNHDEIDQIGSYLTK